MSQPTPERDAIPRITDLLALIAALPPQERDLVKRLFAIEAAEGVIAPPVEMEPWLVAMFGSVEAALRQRVLRVMNRWTFEGAAFNPLRARRPISGGGGAPRANEKERIEAARGDDFCDPERRTPAEVFGRVRVGQVSASSNVARADGWHAVLIFDEHNPLAIDAQGVADLLATTEAWAERVREIDASARHLFLGWNCLWRAGASQVHGHAQVTLSAGMAPARVENWRAAAERYQRETGEHYFADLAAAYRALGLAVEIGPVARFASLTPVKEREILLLTPAGNGLSSIAATLAQTLRLMLEDLGVQAFNVAVFGPPLGADVDERWADFPLVARLVDRGDPSSDASDIAAMELFGSSVIASDPFEVARALKGKYAALSGL
jgi:hypothetical protein